MIHCFYYFGNVFESKASNTTTKIYMKKKLKGGLEKKR